jgi:hypothetical protein
VIATAIAITALVGCGDNLAPAPDAGPVSTVPTRAAGRYAVLSTIDLHVPAAAAPAIATLVAATDGPDDPARFVVDRLIDELPDGSVKKVATAAAPYVAAYVNDRLVDIAPRFVAGLDGLASGLSRIATHLGTVEVLTVDDAGLALRRVTAVRYEVNRTVKVVGLADAGLAEFVAGARVTLDATGRVGISEHQHALPYGALLRLGLDRAVAPSVEPTAANLAGALGALLDCERLGGMVADRVGFGTHSLYATACRAAMTAVAAEVDARLAEIDRTPLGIELAGSAEGFDGNGDGAMDELRSGRWTGAVFAGANREPIDAASFTGEADRR